MFRKYSLFLIFTLFLVSSNAATYLLVKSDTQGQLESFRLESLSENKKSPVVLGDSVAVSDTEVLPTEEVEKRQAVVAASQDDLLTAAVAKVSPAVVSIVISKDVPQLEVVYENPFGNDPFFKDFGFKVPRYRQKGTVNQKVGAGTGFLVSSDGYIVTNRHVVADTGATYTVLLSTGEQKPAQVIYKDQGNDLALVKITGSGYPAVSLGSSRDLKLGQSVFAVGNALGEYNNSISVGVVSGLERDITAGGESLKGVIQTDAAINPGNSGGPLVDLGGQVVGVNVATVQGASSISFSIPIDQVKSLVEAARR